MKMTVLGGVAVLTVSQGALAAGILPYDDPQAVERGAAIYGESCASCHGSDLAGQANWRDRDAEGYLPAPPHDPSGHTWHHPDTQLFAITWSGIEAMVGGGYKSRMAGYQGTLSEQQVLEVLAYIKSTWPAEIIDRHNQINAAASGG